MGKVEISYFFWTNKNYCRYLNFVFAEIFIEYISMFHVTFFLILYFDWLLGPHKGQNFEKHLKIFSKIVYGMMPVFCIHVPDSNLYIICVCFFLFQSDKKSGCYGNLKFR